jgi:hypothetical protein
MAQANTDTSTTSRRRFLTVAAVASAVSASALAAAAMPARSAGSGPISSLDDSALVKLEEQIFEQYQGATAYDDEINRLHPIWVEEGKRLLHETLAGRSTLTSDERWAVVGEMPECIECARLQKLQGAFFDRMDMLVKQMFAMPAHTAEGRRAKVTVLLGCILGNDWRRVDAETDYHELMARRLLIELVGGKPGESLRDQFA